MGSGDDGAGQRSAAARSPKAAESDHPLARTVDRLRDEVEGLQRALVSRGVIEQAKGMLMERYGCSPEEAFERLAKLSQQANIKLVDVASALVGASIPQRASIPRTETPRPTVSGRAGVTSPAGADPTQSDGSHHQPARVTPADVVRDSRRQAADRWPREGNADSEFGSRVRAEARRTRLRAELLGARSFEEVLRALLRHGSAQPPQAAALATLQADGTVVALATSGVPDAASARWARFPIDLDLPVCHVLRDGRQQWLDARQSSAPTELGLGLPPGWRTAALLPLVIRGHCFGVLALTWREGPTAAVRSELERAAAGVAGAVHRLAVPVPRPGPTGAGGDRDAELLAALDVMQHPVLLCRPVRDEGHGIGDLRVVYANPATRDPAGRSAEDLVGRRLVELYPVSVDDGLLEACRHVLRTGDRADLGDHDWRMTVHGRSVEAHARLRLARYGDAVLITWNTPRPDRWPRKDDRGRSS